ARVVVRREGRELARTGIDGLEHRADAEAMTRATHLCLADAADLSQLHVGESVLLRVADGVGIQYVSSAHGLGDLVDQHDLVEEPWVHGRRLESLLDGGTLAQRLLQHDDTSIGGCLGDLQELLYGAVLRAPVEAGPTLLQRAKRLL